MAEWTHNHFGSLEDACAVWRQQADQFEQDAAELELSAINGERTWQEAFTILKCGVSGPISDQEIDEARQQLRDIRGGLTDVMPDKKYHILNECWLSGQMTAAQMQQHMRDDPEFAEWKRKNTCRGNP